MNTKGIQHYDQKLASIIDHTIVRPNATKKEIIGECAIAKKYAFASVCVNSVNIPIVAEELKGSNVKACTAIGFPFGATSYLIKALETRDAIASGADEVDMVINIGAVKNGDYSTIEKEISTVIEAAFPRLVKVVIETFYLTDVEKVKVCKIALKMGAGFVKTSSGYAPRSATVEDVKLMRQTVGSRIGVKAAGGIRSKEFALSLVDAGANRLGMSKSVEIITHIS